MGGAIGSEGVAYEARKGTGGGLVMKTLRFLALLGVVAVVVAACGKPVNIPAMTAQDVAPLTKLANFPHEIYRIEAGDTVQIKYVYHAEMAQEDVVRPDGKITVKLIGEMVVAGMTTNELEKEIARRASDQIKSPEVVISIAKFSEKQVFVGGEVGRPGTLLYRRGLTPLQAVIAAGGFKDTASVDSVVLVRLGPDNTEIISRKINLEEVVKDGTKEHVYLAPNDIVFVPRSSIADANLWVRQHITDLIPFVRGIGASAPIPF
jgi:protein involved in polysaccharide export with SLBB domain